MTLVGAIDHIIPNPNYALCSSSCHYQKHSFDINIVRMSTQSDPEAHIRSDEQTPLLAEQHAETEQAGTEPEIEPTPEKRAKSWYAWRIFWAVLAIVVLAVFIKGWIDSDETEVLLKTH
jgi:uncharacterized membrane protein YraQ (UPF0718 family)